MQKYINNLANTQTGLPIAGASVLVVNYPSLTTATIYSSNVSPAGAVTTPIATPGVVNWTNHGLLAGQSFLTTGTWPTGVTNGTTYYVIATGLTANSFQMSATLGGGAVAFSVSAGSGQVITTLVEADPIITDQNGLFSFYAPDGHYSLRVTVPGATPYLINDIVLSDPLIGDAPSKTTPIGADAFSILDSVTGFLAQLTLTNLVAYLVGALVPTNATNATNISGGNVNGIETFTFLGDLGLFSTDVSKFRAVQMATGGVGAGAINALIQAAGLARSAGDVVMFAFTHNSPTSITGVMGGRDDAGTNYMTVFTENDYRLEYSSFPSGVTTAGVAPVYTLMTYLDYQTGAFGVNSTGGIIGTKLADNANAGSVGEVIGPVTTSFVAIATGTPTTLATLALTAGDWDVFGVCSYVAVNNTTSVTQKYGAINTAANNIGYVGVNYTMDSFVATNGLGTSLLTMNAPIVRVNVNTPTNVYLVGQVVYSVSTLTGGGTIWARRGR